MFPAIGQIFTPGNLLYYFQFALISLGLAAVSLAIGFVLAVLLQAMRMAKNKVLKQSLLDEKNYIITKQGNTKTMKIINKALKKFLASKDYEKLTDKYGLKKLS